MDISSLSVPHTGRSRFSKALPTPPPGIDDQPRTIFRELPDAPPAPLPPKKNSVLITKPSIISLQSKTLNSPLPILPIMAEAPRPRVRAGPIARKPVAKMPPPPPIVEADKKSKAMRRQSSISSLLSAYSRSSSDWAQRSSHESDTTKDSEPSYSPEREELHGLPPVPPKKSMESTNYASSDGTSEVTSYTIIEAFPPPPPLKDASRPRTPSTAHDREGGYNQEGDSMSTSPVSLRSGSSQVGREIWRRRASSKSDAGLVIAELKLPSSNGSTASARKAEPPSTLPRVVANTNDQVIPDPPPKQPTQPQQQLPTTTILPPKITPLSTSLPGRNIRPIKKTELLEGDDEMKKFLKFDKLKGLVRRRGAGGDDDGDDVERASPQSKNEPLELQELQKSQHTIGNAEANKPELPAKDNVTQQQQQQQRQEGYVAVNAPTTQVTGNADLSSASASDVPAPPPKESGKVASTTITRRPVGAVPVQAAQPEPAPEKENVTAPGERVPSTQSASDSRPKNPVGTLPHPRQRQQHSQHSQHAPSVHSQPRSGPTSPTSTTTRPPFLPSSPPAAPSSGMAGYSGPPSTFGAGSPYHQTLPSRPMHFGAHPNRGVLSPRQPGPQSQRSPTSPHGPSPLAGPFAPGNVRGNAAQAQASGSGSGSGAGSSEAKAAPDEPMSAQAAAAVALFPRRQNWAVECTVDGVWPANPLTERHYNCFAKHSKLVNSRNTNYPLACQTCGIADAAHRFMCIHCNLRICVPCRDLLFAKNRNLRMTMDILKEQGRIKDWNQYPKRGQSTLETVPEA